MSAPAYDIKQVGPRAYALFKDGQQISRPSTTREMIEDRLDACVARDIKSGWKNRPCITCGTKFLSEGAHHRMCARCRSNATAIFDGAV